MRDEKPYTYHKYDYDLYNSLSNASGDSSSSKGQSSRLYSSERFTSAELPIHKTDKPDVSTSQLFVNLSSSLDCLFSKIQALKEVHVTEQQASKQMSKKNMDVSGFPMPNLANKQFLKGVPIKSAVPKPPIYSFEQKNDKKLEFDDKKAVSPPTETIFNRPNNTYKYSSNDYISYAPTNYVSHHQSYNNSLKKIDSIKQFDEIEKYSGNLSINKNFSNFSNSDESYSFKSGNQISPTTPTPKKIYEQKSQPVNPFEIDIKPTNKTIQKEYGYFGNAFQQNVFTQNTFQTSAFTGNKLMKNGLMSMPNLKVSMQINENVFDEPLATNNDYSTLRLEKIIQKQTKQSSFFVQKSIIFNQASIRDFELGKNVGSGKFGDVHICRHKETGTMFALKKIFKSTILEYDMVNQFTRELKIHYRLDHPNIIKLYTHFDDEYHIFLLMEYAEGGILMDKLKCTQEIASQYVDQTIEAVQYLHKLKIAHRDIKPQNIVLQFGLTIKLCDFGWASYYQNEMKTTFCGTLDYLSPEMKQKGQYDNSVDIWSIGVLTYQLLTGSPPYRKQLMLSMKNNSGVSKQGARKINWTVNYPSSISPIAESFIRNLLKQNPQQRSSLRFCSNHTFIKKYQHPIQQLSHFREFSKVI